MGRNSLGMIDLIGHESPDFARAATLYNYSLLLDSDDDGNVTVNLGDLRWLTARALEGVHASESA